MISDIHTLSILFVCCEQTGNIFSGSQPMGTKTYGCGYIDIVNRDHDAKTKAKNDRDLVFPWGPVEFNKDNHPLAIMVAYCSLI